MASRPSQPAPGKELGLQALSTSFPQMGAIATQGLKQASEFNSQWLKGIPELNKAWMDRMQSEMDLASQCVAKMGAARSALDIASVWESWASRRMEMASDDAAHLLTDVQKLAQTSARLLSNGLQAAGANGARPPASSPD